MKKLTVFLMLAGIFCYSGCQFAGIIDVIATPTNYEKKIPAEYSLVGLKNKKILVFVDQPAWLNSRVNMRYHLTGAMNNEFMKRAKIPAEYLVSYNELSEFRSNKEGFSYLGTAEVGKALGADLVLLIMIENYQLSKMAEMDYYKGFLDVRAALFDTAQGQRLWPESDETKSINVGFEVEKRGREIAVTRLAKACAYCTVRYFYNCTVNKFKIPDDKSRIGWKDWK